MKPRTSRSSISFLGLVWLVTTACSGGSSGAKAVANEAPTLVFTAPMSAVVVDIGQPVEIRWVADDPDDAATTSVTAIGLSVNHTIELVDAFPETDGVEQSFLWTPEAGDEGTYRIEASTTDGDRTTYATAPGTIGVGVVAPTAAGAAVVSEGGTILASDACPDGSFVVAGAIRQGTDAVFDSGGVQETRLTTETYDAFVAKLAPDGELLWARQTYALSLSDGQVDSFAYPWDVVALPGGGCVLDIAYQGTVTVGLGTANEATWSAPLDRSRELLVCYDAAGGVSWSRPVYDADMYTGSGDASLDFVSDDTFVLTAERSGDLTFDLGGPNETFLSGDNSYVYLAAFEDDGNFLFASDVACSEDGYIERLNVHASERGIWLAGLFEGTLTFGLGSPEETTLSSLSEDGDQLLAYFDIDEGFRWARHLAGVSVPGEGDELLTIGITTDASGATYVLSGPLEQAEYRFDLGGSQPTTVTVGEDEQVLVLARYEESGELAWLRTLTSENFEEDSQPGPVALSDGVAVAARFEEFVEGDGFRLEESVAPGRGSLFLARFDAAGTLEWALNDGGDEDRTGIASLTGLPGDRLLLTGNAGAYDANLELGTNEAESTFLQGVAEVWFSFRAVYSGDGGF